MEKRSILSDDELAQGAQTIADDVRIAGTGRVMLARVIDAHLDWFERARARGLAWSDIIDVLFRAGVTRPDGRPLSRGHLSSLVWRKQKSAAATPPALVPTPTPEAKRPKRRRSGAPNATTPSGDTHLPLMAGSKPAPSPVPTTKSTARPGDAEGDPDGRNNLLAYMRRAARVRGND